MPTAPDGTTRWRRIIVRLLGVAAVASAVGVMTSWHRMTTWGATTVEASTEVAGDEIVPAPKYASTHAVTIHAPVEDVWPWLVQMGQGRGGLYSYDWLENLVGCRMHSADRVVPALQGLAVGDEVRLVPADMRPMLRFVVARLESPHLLVLGPDRTRPAAFAEHLSYPSWAFRLVPRRPEGCRLVVRFRSDFEDRPWAWLAYRHALQPVHTLMERRMLLGIKQRAEAAA